MTKQANLTAKTIILESIGISKNVFEYRCKELDLTPPIRGQYTNEQINKIKYFNKTQKSKRRKTPKIIDRFQLVKFTEVYHIYESKMNKL
jgi:hypothetical protein